MEPAAPCERPFVFRDAAVNAVVMPYLYAGRKLESRAQSARNLSLLIQVEVLFSALKYGSVGAVQNIPRSEDDPECSPDAVLEKLLGRRPGAEQELRPGGGLILIWGRIFERGQDIYVQTYVRFLRRDSSEVIRLSFGGPPLLAAPSVTAFSFAPRKLTLQDLFDIGAQYARARLVHEQPDDSSAVVRISLADPSVGGYSVEETWGTWMKIRLQHGGRGGWIRAAPTLGGTPLHHKMPELHFIETLVGYLRMRAASAGNAPAAPERSLDWASEALGHYETESEGRVALLSTAVGKELIGILRMTGPDASDSELEKASTLFREAVALLPYDAEARNLEILSRIALAGHGRRLRARATADEMVALIPLAPANGRFASNLQSYYTTLRMGSLMVDPSDLIEAAELEQRVRSLRVARVGPRPIEGDRDLTDRDR